MVLNAGLRDTYREAHPDPVEHPGVTHPRTGDRIDFLYAGGPMETLQSRLIGKEGQRGVQVGFDRWTSDHRAVLSTVEVRPRAFPVMVSVSAALLPQGDPLTVAYQAPGPAPTVEIVEEGSGSAVESRSFGRPFGRFDVETSSLTPGGYHAVLRDEDGTQIEQMGFWVRPRNTTIEVATDRRSYRVGQPITVTWDHGPANRWDWIGIYKAAKSNPKVHYYLLWNYTDLHGSGTVPPSVSDSVTMDGSAQGSPWPLPPGEYVVHYLVADRYRSIGHAEFAVTAPSAS
jgi:hypothetical protein